VAIDRTIGRTIYRWHVRLYRLTRGVIGHRSPLGPMLILETRGRRSGLKRAVTLLYYEKDNNYYVVASNGGRPSHPEWLFNVRRNPGVSVQISTRIFPAIARELPSTEQPELWRELVNHYRGWAEYQLLTDRTISVGGTRPNSTRRRPLRSAAEWPRSLLLKRSSTSRVD
jgi:deazaflavin-dependent oxidoreductase (nitroreductase family)